MTLENWLVERDKINDYLVDKVINGGKEKDMSGKFLVLPKFCRDIHPNAVHRNWLEYPQPENYIYEAQKAPSHLLHAMYHALVIALGSWETSVGNTFDPSTQHEIINVSMWRLLATLCVADDVYSYELVTQLISQYKNLN